MTYIQFTKAPENNKDDEFVKKILNEVGFFHAKDNDDLWQSIAFAVLSGTQTDDNSPSWSSTFKSIDKHFNEFSLVVRNPQEDLCLNIEIQFSRDARTNNSDWRYVSIKIWDVYFNSDIYYLVQGFCTESSGWKIHNSLIS